MTGDWLRTLAERLAQRAPGALVVGYSGGHDSTVLLHALSALPEARLRGLRALHVDHGLQPASARWAEQCRAQALAWGVPFALREVTVERGGGLGLEGAARAARYAAFMTELAPGETLVLAQHCDDQAETLLLRLLRGAGTGAAAGMRETRPLGAGQLWRPLLSVSRAELSAYAITQGLRWIDDPSNHDTTLARNHLRHEILPRLQRHWPQATATLARSAHLLGADAELIDAQARTALAQVQTLDPACLSIPALRRQPPAVGAQLVRLWLAELGLPPPPAAVLERIGPELLEARPDGEPALRWRRHVLRRYRDLLHVGLQRPRPAATGVIDWDGQAPLAWPDGGMLRFSETPHPPLRLTVHPRRGGELLTLSGRPRRPLKHLLQEAGVPPWERERLPLLYCEDALCAVGDLFFSADFDRWLRDRGLGLHWQI